MSGVASVALQLAMGGPSIHFFKQLITSHDKKDHDGKTNVAHSASQTNKLYSRGRVVDMVCWTVG